MTTETTTPKKRIRRSPAAESMQTVLQELHDANTKVRELTAALDKAIAEKKTAETNGTYNREQKAIVDAEIEQLHAVLDALPGAIGRETPTGDNSWEKRKNAAMTRLASWLAIRDR